MENIASAGPYAVKLQREPEMPIVIIETNFKLKLRYEADMEFFFLACDDCNGRIESGMNFDPRCRECKKVHPHYRDCILILPGEAALSNILRSWAQDFLDSFELLLTVEALGERLKAIHNSLKVGQDARYKPYEETCLKYSGLLETF